MKATKAQRALEQLADLVTDSDHQMLTDVEQELVAEAPLLVNPSPQLMLYTSLPWVLEGKKPRTTIEELWYPTIPKLGTLVDRTVVPNGNLRPTILFVGIAPRDAGPLPKGQFTRAWTSGPSSLLLKRALQSVSLLTRSAFSNIMKQPTPGNRPPSQQEAGIHVQCLNREIALLKPRAIVVMGNDARRWFPMTEKTSERGVITRNVTFIRHPSYCLRSGIGPDEYGQSIKDQVRRALK